MLEEGRADPLERLPRQVVEQRAEVEQLRRSSSERRRRAVGDGVRDHLGRSHRDEDSPVGADGGGVRPHRHH